MRKILIYLFLTFLLTQCSRNDITNPALSKTSWELQSIINNSSGVKTNIPSSIGPEIIEFIDSSGIIGVTTCANGCSGYYKLYSNDSLKIKGFGCTTIAPADTNCTNWERYLLISLETSNSYSLTGRTLIIKSIDKYNLVFNAK